ncbi:MAG: 1-acyl-sn-glycerol-3-phosphate acyltransferase [Ruminococcaceae bacterium]|nr:1-acyl-sn-glycerol-3-phosphate acyltransferase [Oscillospiraceae bacterium]
MGRKNNKKKRWISPRHKFVRDFVCLFLKPYSILKYGIKVEKFREDKKRNYLILYNHQTAFDQFFVGMSFKDILYYVASEDIFSKGWVSSLIRFLVNPIPIKKQTTDVRAIMNCIKVANEGGSIAIAPEGNRTYSGKTVYMNPTIVPLARKLGLPVLLYRIEGGYGVHPRWSDVVRRGNMRSYVARVIEPEEYKGYTDDEFMNVIKEGLYVNEAVADGEFRHRKTAEYLERAMYVCPFCGFAEFESHGNMIECKKCGRKTKYGTDKRLTGEGFEFPFEFVGDWYDYQCSFINRQDVNEMTDQPIYTETIDICEVIPYKKKVLIKKGAVSLLYGDRVEIPHLAEGFEFRFDDVSAVSVLGRNKLNVYHGDKIYQIKGGKRFNALKYVNIYHRYNNIKKGDNVRDGEFLGL